MANFEDAFNTVCELVKDFKENEERYLSPQYQEAEVRRDFVDKFFEALGWDVYHNTQKNPYEQEVKVEKGVNVGKAQKRADYAFYITPEFRQPKFFAEAKKPNRSLKNPDDYFQTIRYGWNANTPIAVLTDFEEFHILDCRFKPNIDAVLQNQNHKSYKYTEYEDSEKFKEIFYLFSRETVADNSLQKYSDSLPKPIGKATQWGLFKGIVKPIDEDFLEYIDEVRETLAKAFKKNDSNLTSEELTEATQRTIDRLVFIRFLEDKLIEPEYYISEFGKKGNAWNEFISVCRKLDAKYNGIVFKKHFIDEQNFQGPEQNTFKKICDEMSYINSPYDFNAIPIHILGSIYERFLGKVVNATAQRVKIEEKPEVRKAGGVYYTPKYIVDYIVENTVGKIIKGKTPVEISKLRFADIACGSGSFLIGVFETLLKYHTEYYQLHPEQAKKNGCINKDGQWILSIKQKQNILLNNIYGVDIDNQAVEVTQLSLALKMLEDESTATANEMQVLFHEKILPDLSKNIVCGNSLIGTDIYSENLFEVHDDFNLNAMSFNDKFPEIFNNGGFDAIIGNPPWGQKAVYFQDYEKEYLKNKYPSSSEGILDLFRFFIEKGIKLLKINGEFGYVLPDIILLKNYESTRKLLLDNLRIDLLYYWGMIFKDVNLDVCTISGKKDLNEKNNIIKINIYKNGQDLLLENRIMQNKFNELSGYKFNLYYNDKIESILKKIEGNKFEEYFAPHEGIHSGNIRNKLFLEYKINEHCKKLIFGRDEVKRYHLKWNGKWVDYRKEIINKSKNEYAGLGKKEYFEVNKIIVRRTGDFVLAAIDYNNYYFSNNVFVCIPTNKDYELEYFLGLLNSDIITWYYLAIQPRKGKLFSELKINQLKSFPVPKLDFNNSNDIQCYNKIIKIVKEIVKLKNESTESKTEKNENTLMNKFNGLNLEMNNLFYNLFKLDEEEVKYIQNNIN